MIYYNSGVNGFFDSNINEIPKNSIEIPPEYHAELLTKQSRGMIVQPNELGYPIAVELAMTSDDIITKNKSIQQKLLVDANQNISILQDATELDMLEPGDADLLRKWKKYRVLLMRVDTGQCNVSWPQKPV